MKAALLGETSEALLCSGERDATWYCSSVGELIFLWASSGGGRGSSTAVLCALPGRLSLDSLLRPSSGALWSPHCVGGGALLAESLFKAWMASCGCGGLERLGGGVYCGRLTWCCSGEWRVLMEGSEGLRWSEGERSDGCRWAAASWLGDMVEGWADGRMSFKCCYARIAGLLLPERLLY